MARTAIPVCRCWRPSGSALERLAERDEAGTVSGRHADYYRGLAEQAEPELLGPGQGVWYERLEADFENLRAALVWSLGHQDAEVRGAWPGRSCGSGVIAAA